MRIQSKAILVCALLFVSTSSWAAKPVKITPGQKGVASSGDPFRSYTVHCSNGKSLALTSWRNGKQWCVGRESLDSCSKKQVKAAKGACRIS